MTQETIDTRGQFDHSIPAGEKEFRIEKIRPEGGGKTFRYIWELTFDGPEEREFGEQTLFPNMMGDLLRILGCAETAPGSKKFNWDRDTLPGKSFIATVSHDPDRKDPNKIRQNMTGFKKSDKEDEIPF